MADILLHDFERFPEEAAIIGRIIAGYGELEYWWAKCLGRTLNDDDSALRMVFRQRDAKRIETADALMRPAYQKAGLGDKYNEMLGAIRHCRTIRNQYAHSHWISYHEAGLFFGSFEHDANKKGDGGPFTIPFRHVDVPLLQLQDHIRSTHIG
jgi:hypothetical protein